VTTLPRVRVVIGALSANGLEDRRERCRRTWMADARAAAGVEAFFVIGGHPEAAAARDGDEVRLPCPDDYWSLPQKTAALFQYALDNFDFDYLFKCDDDTYVSIPRLLAVVAVASADYVGCDIGGCASGGAGYLLARGAVGRIVSAVAAHATGAEDRIVGQAVREAGMTFRHDGRFVTWYEPGGSPRADNDIITTHPIRDDLMSRIHAEAGAARAPLRVPGDLAIEIAGWETQYGALGLGGRRGHVVDGSDVVDTSALALEPAPFETIAAHASSTVVIDTAVPVALRGFTDGAAWDMPGSPIHFEVDGQPIGTLSAGGRRTREVALGTPGRHRLVARCDGDVTRRYSAWAVRRYRPDGLRIVMPTSNRYVGVARASLALLDRRWPDHPPVDVVRHEREVDAPASVRQFYAGPQAELTWVGAVARYLEQENRDELFLLMLDDYAMCGPVKRGALEHAIALMRDDPSVASYLLTWMGAPGKQAFPGQPGTILFPRWDYTFNLQAAIWRRSTFLRILRGCGMAVNIGTVENAGTDAFNAREFDTEKAAGADVPEPSNASLFLDGVDKDGWVVPYHNLVHQGALDARHAGFLAAEGLAVEWA
jgi:hypothetical protein